MIHYILVRRDLPFGVTLAQVAHAAALSNWLIGCHCTVAVLGVRDEKTLWKWEKKLIKKGFGHSLVCEPDAPWNGQLMAIGVKPGNRDYLAPTFRKLQTYREQENNG